MIDPLARLLETRPHLLADGAMGTNLFAAGLEAGGAPELWNVEHADRVAAVHRGFVDAGSDVILTNTFGGNRYRLALHDAAGRVGELNRAGARLARAAADRAGREVVVAGSLGPTGELLEPLGPLTVDEAQAAFAEQAAALAAGGVDVLWVETMSSREEVGAAVRGAATTGLAVAATMTFDTAGRTMMGVGPTDAMALARGLAPRPVAFGANCGVGPAELIVSVLALARAAEAGEVLIAKGNCGVPAYVDGRVVYATAPEVMAAYARLARDAGARIIGGCCGSTPAHIRAMAAALEHHVPGPPPDQETLVRVLGPVAETAEDGGRQGDRGRRSGPAGGRRRPGS